MSSTNGWTETKDPKSGRIYFYNKITKKTSWTRPAEMDEPAATPSEPAATAPTPAAVAAAPEASTASSDPEENAANWAEGEDKKTGRKYFYNKVTKKTSWKKPPCMGGDATSPVATPPAAAAPTPTPTPAPVAAVPVAAAAASTAPAAGGEWSETVDQKTGRKYWYNKVTKKTTWKDPYADGTATRSVANI
jgi:hypothetical protein